MPLNPLNHYSIENPPSVYDEEAMTALKLAGRTAQKVNECVEAINKHEANTDKRVNEAYAYLKDNLHSTLSGIVDDMHDSGELAEIVTNEVMPMLSVASGLSNNHIVFVDNIPGIAKFDKKSNVDMTGCRNAEIIQPYIQEGVTLKFGPGVYPFECELKLVSRFNVTSDFKTATLYFPESRGFVADNRAYYHLIDIGNVSIISKGHCIDVKNDGVSFPYNIYFSTFHDLTLTSEDGHCFYAGNNIGAGGDHLVFQCKFTNIYVSAKNGAGFYGPSGLGVTFTNISDLGYCFAVFQNCHGTWIDCNTSFAGSDYFLYIDKDMRENYGAYIIMRNVNMEDMGKGGIFVVNRSDFGHSLVHLENVSVKIKVPTGTKSDIHPLTLGLNASVINVSNLNFTVPAGWDNTFNVPFSHLSFYFNLGENVQIKGGVKIYNRNLSTVQEYNVNSYKIAQRSATAYLSRAPYYKEIDADYFHGYRGKVFKTIDISTITDGLSFGYSEHYDGIVLNGGTEAKTIYFIKMHTYNRNDDGSIFYIRNESGHKVTLSNGVGSCKWKFLENGEIEPNSIKIFTHFYNPAATCNHYIEIANVTL